MLHCLEDSLARHPFHDAHGKDQLERLAALYDQALDAINQAHRIVDASWEQQVESLPPCKAPGETDARSCARLYYQPLGGGASRGGRN